MKDKIATIVFAIFIIIMIFGWLNRLEKESRKPYNAENWIEEYDRSYGR